MPALSQYTNVNGTATAVLRSKGFQVWWDESLNLYFAERDGWDFAADDPIALLGLVAIFEDRRPTGYREYWWRSNGDAEAADVPSSPQRAFVSVLSGTGGADE